MKIIASLLIAYISLLMAQPFVNMGLHVQNKPDNCHPNELCCKEMAKQQGKAPVNSNTSCNRDFCNPFVPCGTSLVYNFPVHRFEKKVFELTEKVKPALNDAIISDYLSDCWHPPKLS